MTSRFHITEQVWARIKDDTCWPGGGTAGESAVSDCIYSSIWHELQLACTALAPEVDRRGQTYVFVSATTGTTANQRRHLSVSWTSIVGRLDVD